MFILFNVENKAGYTINRCNGQSWSNPNGDDVINDTQKWEKNKVIQRSEKQGRDKNRDWKRMGKINKVAPAMEMKENSRRRKWIGRKNNNFQAKLREWSLEQKQFDVAVGYLIFLDLKILCVFFFFFFNLIESKIFLDLEIFPFWKTVL